MRTLPVTFRWLLLGAFASALATFVVPFLALFLATRGFPPSRIGLTVGLYGLGAAVASPVYGALADRWGRRPVLVGTLLAAAAITAAIPWLEGTGPLSAAVLAIGLTSNGYRPVVSAVVADVVPPEDRQRAYGMISWALNVGVGVALAVGGTLAEGGYERLFLVDAATTALFAVVVLAKVPETRPASAGRPGGPGFAEVLADRTYLGLLAISLLFVVPFAQFTAALPLAMGVRGLGPQAFGLTMAVNCGLIGLFQLRVSRLTSGHDPSRLLALAALLVGVGYGAYALAGPLWGWMAATAIWTWGEMLAFPAVETLVSALAPEALRGRYLGGVSAAYGTGFALAPALGGAVLERWGARTLWLACLATGLAVAAAHLAHGPARRRALAARRPDGV